MIEITEEELKAVKILREQMSISTPYESWDTIDKMLNRIEAERKPKGCLQKEIEDWRGSSNPHARIVITSLQCMSNNIARIFDEEMDEARIELSGPKQEVITRLERRICGEGKS